MKRPPHPILTLLSLAQAVLLASAGTSMANLALPALAQEYSAGLAGARWVVIAYLAATTVFSLGAGTLADRKGGRGVLLTGIAVFAFAALIAAGAPSIEIVIAARALQGVGAAALVVLPMSLAVETVGRERSGRAVGLLATMSAIGTASGPSLGGLLLSIYGWRSVFAVMAGLAALNWLLVYGWVRPNQGHSSAASFELKSLARPELHYNLVVSAVMMGTLVVGPFYLSQALHMPPLKMGLILSAGPITSMLSGVFTGYIADRFGSRRVREGGLLLLMAGALAFVLLPAQAEAGGFAASAVLLSLGYQLFLAANSSHLMQTTEPERRGQASGALNLSRNLGLILGSWLFGGIFDSVTGSAGAQRGLQISFLSASALVAAAFAYQHINQRSRQ